MITLCCVCLCMTVLTVHAEEKRSAVNPPYGIARGFSNLMFGWLEVPRGIIYENARIPVVGFVTGPVKGALLTTWRTLAGVTDVVAMGLTREGLYGPMLPDFVWDADWVPPCGEDMVPGPANVDCNPCPNTCPPCPQPVRSGKMAVVKTYACPMPCTEVCDESCFEPCFEPCETFYK